jgi:hypothetical protein
MSTRRWTLSALVSLCLAVAALSLGASALAAAPPIISGESFSDVGSSSATLSAQINAEGIPSSYSFEYGATVAYGSSTSTKSLGSRSEAASALVSITGLQPDTIYHFRVVATNGDGTVRGEDASFRTFPASFEGLSDTRGYEMVSAAGLPEGTVYEPFTKEANPETGDSESTERPFQAAADGNAMAYIGAPSQTGGSGAVGSSFGNQYLAERLPGGGWTSANIEPPSGSLAETTSYEAFSSNLEVGILDWRGATPLTAGAPGQLYNVLYTRSSNDGSYRSLFDTTPSREPEEFSAYELFKRGAEEAPLLYAGASATYEHLLFIANDALTPDAVDGGETENNLYDSVDGQPYLVNILPDGKAQPNAIFGAPIEAGESFFTRQTRNPPDFSHAISSDGTRIFWTDLNTGDLYVRENDTQPQSSVDDEGHCTIKTDGCTVEVDATQGPGSSGGGRFWTATSDGSKVLFTDPNRLTVDSTAGPEEPDLYEYDLESGRLTDLTVDSNAGEHANVLGVLGASEDGSYIYFVADGVLASGAHDETCVPSTTVGEGTGACNLYVIHGTESPKFIAALSGADDSVENTYYSPEGDWQPGLGNRTAQVTPDGLHLVFVSRQQLTDEPNHSVYEAYLYDYEANESQHISCVSCDPSGELPPAGNLSVLLPPSYSSTYMQRWMSDDGSRVFFDSLQPLVSQDTNGKLDVYEWERDGSGSCQRSGGCIYLLSAGTSTDNSFLLDASLNGDDLFFETRSQLGTQEHSEAFVIYDARVGAPQPLSRLACTGSGCQGVPPAPPVFATPSSVTFTGVGNFSLSLTASAKPKPKSLTTAQKLARALKTCRGGRRQRKQRLSCEAAAKRRYGPGPKLKSKAKGGK